MTTSGRAVDAFPLSLAARQGDRSNHRVRFRPASVGNAEHGFALQVYPEDSRESMKHRSLPDRSHTTPFVEFLGTPQTPGHAIGFRKNLSHQWPRKSSPASPNA